VKQAAIHKTRPLKTLVDKIPYSDFALFSSLAKRCRIPVLQFPQYDCMRCCNASDFAYDKWLVSHWYCLSAS